MTTKIKGIVAPNNAQAIQFTEANGNTPTQTTEGMYLTNATATAMTNIQLPFGTTDSRIVLLAANSNTTLHHGLGIILKGATNVLIPANGIIELIKFSAHNTSWIEKSRSF